MHEMKPGTSFDGAASERTTTLFQQSQNRIHRRADRLFANLMVAQWLAGIAAALWISPKTWIGAASQIHGHVWAAIFLGGAITAFPVFLAWRHPGRVLTRHVIAVAQMLTSALLIHLSGGRIETHFHVFGSLAFFAFYRDWRVLLTATVVVALDHMVRGIFWPQSVFGILTTSPWRWIEHAGWVVFEDVFLFISIRQSLQDMFEVAARRANLEAVNADIERQVAERTVELTRENAERKHAEEALRKSEAQLQTVVENLTEGVAVSDLNGQLIHFNRAALEMHGYASLDECRHHLTEFADTFELSSLDGTVLPMDRWPLARILRNEKLRGLEVRVRRAQIDLDRIFSFGGTLVHDAAGQPLLAVVTISDLTKRKRDEAELEDVHKQLLDIARQAGMAEVATGVLHNVGNALNSVNVSATLIAERVQKSKVANLGKAVTLLREHTGNLGQFLTTDAKGKQLPDYLHQLGEHLDGEQRAVLNEVESLRKDIEHIKDIVAMQQNYAKVSGVVETVKASELADDALRMNTSWLARNDIRVVRECEEGPVLSVEKHKVLQILVNLIRNAKNACDETGRVDKQVTLRVTAANGRVSFSVIDNGVGILPENLTRIFAHGFTTKKDGHGFGLHSGALVAKELGGELRVHSDGFGQGATFILELPLEQRTAPKLKAA